MMSRQIILMTPAQLNHLKQQAAAGLAANDLANAKAFITPAHQAYPNDPEVNWLLADLFVAQGYVAQGVGLLKKAAERKRNTRQRPEKRTAPKRENDSDKRDKNNHLKGEGNPQSEGVIDPWRKLTAFINARLAKGDDAMPEIVSAWVVIAGESVRQPEIKALYQNLIDQQLKELKKLIADVWEGKTARNKEVINLAAVVLASMEGAFQLSATANEVMPKSYAAETILGLIATAIGILE